MPTPSQIVRHESIFLYGPPGAGKSSLGSRLSASLHLPFYDLDQMIQFRAGCSIPEIFAAEGESGFRKRERDLLKEVIDKIPAVVALGGGALLDGDCRLDVENAARVLCLSASFEALCSRLQSAGEQRPLLQGDASVRLRALLERRSAHYASFPMQLDTTGILLEDLAWRAQVLLGLFCVSGMETGQSKAYDVRVVENGLDSLGAALLERGLTGPVALVSDDRVGPLYASRALESMRLAGYPAQAISIPAGEKYKTIPTIQYIWEGFLEAGLERGSTVVALGGGVVGDLAGFAAAAYLRGVNWVTLPTTLLAMADASLGGKTGADLPQGKNLVGAFYPPRLVLADPATLATLPEVELRNGLAEVVKHGIIGDPALFERCRQGWHAIQSDWGDLVRRAMAVKVQVILEDPYEKGRRASLNLGHTLGHAIEQVSEYQIKHGEAVAIGMVAAARLSEQMGLAERGLSDVISETLAALGLPTQLPHSMDPQSLLRAMGVDKKRLAGKVRLALPVRVGEVQWGVEIDDLGLLVAVGKDNF